MEEKKKSQRQAVYDSSLDNFLDSSRTLFQTKEFADTTIRDIAKQAGKSVGTLYHYFPNGKEDVVRHLLLRDFYEPHLKLQKYIKEHFEDDLADVLHQAYHDFVSIFIPTGTC